MSIAPGFGDPRQERDDYKRLYESVLNDNQSLLDKLQRFEKEEKEAIEETARYIMALTWIHCKRTKDHGIGTLYAHEIAERALAGTWPNK